MVLSIKAKGIICGVSNSEKTRCCCCSLRLKGIANNCTNVNKAAHCFQMFSSVFCKILVQTILQDSSLLLTHKTSKERQKKKKKNAYNIWTATSEFGTYRLCEQRRFRRACAFAQSRQNLRCSLLQAVSQE